MSVISIISWVIVGLIAGALAKLIYPGHQGGGIIATIGLGLLGALVGGWIGSALFGVTAGFSIPGIIVSILGAMLLIFIWGLITRRTA